MTRSDILKAVSTKSSHLLLIAIMFFVPSLSFLLAPVASAGATVVTAKLVRPIQVKIVEPVSFTGRHTEVVYVVVSGNTLSGIAKTHCGVMNDWTGIYEANKRTIGPNPNLILPGQTLTLLCTDPPALLSLAKPTAPASGKVWGVTYGYPNFCGDGDGDGWDVACQPRQPVYSSQPTYNSLPSATVTYSGSGAMQQCIISRESGGQSQIMNSTGHYGLYQFSYSTWVGSGGNGADFGHASVAEQNQVFANAVAARGYSDWAPYDGC